MLVNPLFACMAMFCLAKKYNGDFCCPALAGTVATAAAGVVTVTVTAVAQAILHYATVSSKTLTQICCSETGF